MRLYLLRHGKSDWDLSGGGDHERPLAKRGRSSAQVIGRYLSGLEPFPQKVICSSARRAEETVRLAAEAGKWSCPIHITDRLYSSSSDDLLDFLRGCSDDDQSLLLAGHMPSLPDLIRDLVGGAKVKFPTAALAAIDLSVRSWSEAEPECGTLLWLVTPKILVARNPSES